jgi:hypothetical protein
MIVRNKDLKYLFDIRYITRAFSSKDNLKTNYPELNSLLSQK